jgi:hypothetical protein
MPTKIKAMPPENWPKITLDQSGSNRITPDKTEGGRVHLRFGIRRLRGFAQNNWAKRIQKMASRKRFSSWRERRRLGGEFLPGHPRRWNARVSRDADSRAFKSVSSANNPAFWKHLFSKDVPDGLVLKKINRKSLRRSAISRNRPSAEHLLGNVCTRRVIPAVKGQFCSGYRVSMVKKKHPIKSSTERRLSRPESEVIETVATGQMRVILRQQTLKSGQKCMTTVTAKKMKEFLLSKSGFFREWRIFCYKHADTWRARL